MEIIEALSEDEHCIEEMTEVVGFQHMSGITSAGQMFGSCPKLETIYATSFSNSGLSGSLMFNGCNRLVGPGRGCIAFAVTVITLMNRVRERCRTLSWL